GRLARRRLAGPGQLRPVVALARLAPAAVGVLVVLQPAHRALHVLLAEVLADGAQPAEDGPGTVDVVDPPPAEPGPVGTLRAPDEAEGAPGRLEVGAVAERAQQLEPAAGEVLGRRVEQRPVVGERDV